MGTLKKEKEPSVSLTDAIIAKRLKLMWRNVGLYQPLFEVMNSLALSALSFSFCI